VRFIGLAADLDGKIVERGWDFGDGTNATGDRAEHQYTEPGNYQASFYAEDDDALRSVATLEIQVLQNGMTTPRIISVPALSATSGQPYSYDQDGRPSARGSKPLTWSLVNSPEDMTIDDSTGELTWTPAKDQTGLQPVTLMVENDAGSDLQEFEIEVAQGIEPPTDSGCSCSHNRRMSYSLGLALLLLGALVLRRTRRS
jgi:PKD repeat protein